MAIDSPQAPRAGRHSLACVTLGLLTLAGLASPGCTTVGEEDDAGGSCELLAGDLVITEIMADPEGPDEGREWFEIYNASSEAIDLAGLTLVYTRADGSAARAHVVASSLELAAGDYVVVGNVLPEVAEITAHIDYGYGNELGAFTNGGGYLAVECSDASIIDEVFYGEATSGVSRAFDGSQVPDATANDDLTAWCDSRTEFDGPDFVATPGTANDPCGGGGSCLEDGEPVEVLRPNPGELVITEVHADPDIVADNVGEWFEVHSLAGDRLHLNGLTLGRDLEDEAEDQIAAFECVSLEPGAYGVIARSADTMINGGVPAEAIVWETSLSLTNSDGSLWIGDVSGTVLDAVTWSGAPKGASTQLDPGFFDVDANDELGNWCDAEIEYGDGDLGTPGAENGQCLIDAPEGQCYAGSELRDIEPVTLGDLVITELLSNPEAVADADGEWFEVLVKSDGDLNGLEIGKGGGVQDTLESGDGSCLSVTAGSYLVFARDADPSSNGGLPSVDYTFDMALNNSGGDLFIGYEGEVWDEVTWASRAAGRSYSLAPGNNTTEGNDDPDNWCDGSGVYGDGDEGTPGEENPSCGGSGGGMCLDPDTSAMRAIAPPSNGDLVLTEVMPNPDEVPDATGEWFELRADASFDLNGLQIGKAGAFDIEVVSEDCIEASDGDYLVLARSATNNGELPNLSYAYDGGFSLNNSNGSLQVGYDGEVFDETSWASSPTGAALSLDETTLEWCPAVDPYGAGDLGTPGVTNPACDGNGGSDGQCLDGASFRDIVPPAAGELVITEFMANPAAVSDSAGEWFELRALAAFDLNGLELGKEVGDGPLETIDVAECIELSAGETALLARNNDSAANGGLPEVDVEFGFSLNNSNSGLFVASDGDLLDAITWTSVADGSSTSLDPGSYDPDLNDTANNVAPWCYASQPYGDGDNGSPKADNPSCN